MAARRGDKRAFVEIVARHQAMVCGVALGILGDFAASEDAGQEAFLTAWRKFQDLREPERLRPWLGQIARNAALGQLRRKRPHDTLADDAALADDSPTPDQAAATEEEAALVRESLAKLPEAQRLPLVLYYREGQSVRAVAEVMGISEDAVKQRLARGREMLRERMSGIIETVLKRSTPTAVFTMTIAAAIGALAAPSAVAGTVLAAGTTAGVSTANVSTTPLFTAMSSSKAFLVTASLVAVLCIPIGYRISGTAVSRQADNNVSVARTEKLSLAPPGAQNFEGSALFAEWRELHDRYGTNAAAMPSLFKAINDLKDPFRRLGFRSALFAEWVGLDPAGGFAFFLAKGRDEAQRKQFFDEWFERDPQAAVSALKTATANWEELARSSLTNIAQRVPGSVADLAARLPKADSYWDKSVRDAFVILANNGLDSARTAAETLTGPNRDQALAGIAMAWAKTDLNAAVAWAKGLPDGVDRDEIIRTALLGKASVDPIGALDNVGLVPEGGRNAYFASTTGARVLEAAANTDFDATVAWLTAHPGRLGQEDLMGLAYPVTQRLNADATGFLATHAADGSLSGLVPAINSALLNGAAGLRPEIWDWIKTQPESDAVQSIKQEVLNSAAWQDPKLALQLVQDLPTTPEGDREVKTVAEALFNGGNLLSRFDQLMPQSPDRLRQPLVEAAFNFLNGDNIGNPQQWINRLSQLPASSLSRGSAQIAGAWTQQDPEDAIAWAGTLAPGDARSAAMSSIASIWAHTDAPDTAAWVTTLAAGPDRDRSAQALVSAIAQSHPQEAWDWAISINDTTERRDAATEVVRAMAAKDPATAQQWIQASPFSDETKASLQTLVNTTRPPTPH